MTRFVISFLVLHSSFTSTTSHYAQEFYELLKKPYFVDKSNFIKCIFNTQSSKVLLSAPRGFGKTISLQMLQVFLEIEVDDYGVPKHPRNSTARQIFSQMKINRSADVVETHMAKHPVLFFDLKANPGPASFSRQDIICFMNRKLYDAFDKHSWLLQIAQDELVNDFGISESSIKLMRKLYERNLGNENEKDDFKLFDVYVEVAAILSDYYRSSLFVLVDNYDSVLNSWYRPSGQGILDYYDLINGFLQSIFEIVDPQVFGGGVVMGTSALILANALSFVSMTELHAFMSEETKFGDCFGFDEDEIVKILNQCECQDRLSEIKSWYNGYKTIYQDVSVYNPSSVIQYLNNLHKNPAAKVYWNISQEDNFLLSFVNDSLLRIIMGKVSDNGTTGFHMAETYTSTNFQLFFKLCEDYKYASTDQGLLLWYIYDQGYVSHRVVQKPDDPSQFLDAMGAPNLETRRVLKKLFDSRSRFDDAEKAISFVMTTT